MQKNNNYRYISSLLIITRGLIELGDALFSIIVQVQIYNLQPTGINLSLLMLIRNLPIIVIGLFSGTIVDSMKKSNLLSICIALMSTIIVCSAFSLSLSFLLLLMFLYRCIYAFYKITRSAILPTVLEKQDILKCTSSIMIVQEIATVTASFLIAKYFTVSVKALIIVAVFCLIIALLLILTKIHPFEKTTKFKAKNIKDLKTFVADTKKGWTYFLLTKALRILVIIVALVWLSIGGFSSIQIIYLTKSIKIPSHFLGLSESIISIGNLTGYFIVVIASGKVVKQNKLSKKLYLGYLLSAVAMLLCSEVSTILSFSILLIIYATGEGFSNAIEESLEQQLPPHEQLGKSLSIISSVGTIGYILGVTISPILTDFINVSSVIKLSSCCMFITAVVIFKNTKVLFPEKTIKI